MSEKKNIVIKVKYPSSGALTEKHATAPAVITEWNFQRIAMVLGSLLFAMMMWFYFTNDDMPANNDEQLEQTEQQASVTVQSNSGQTVTGRGENLGAAQAELSPGSKNSTGTSKSVVRSQLTKEIKQNEPLNNLKVPLKIGKKDNLWIYYFVELKGMNGRAIYHEWWLNGNLVSRKKVNVSGDPWRTASKQLITYTTNNDWIVRVVDESRNTLTEKSFNLEIK